ncbi:hypothetical protein VTN02DRAFT_6513 [Thermoascus thermophilus]
MWSPMVPLPLRTYALHYSAEKVSSLSVPGVTIHIDLIPGRHLAGKKKEKKKKKRKEKKPSVSPEVVYPCELCDTQMILVGMTYYPTVQDLPCAFFRAHGVGMAWLAVLSTTRWFSSFCRTKAGLTWMTRGSPPSEHWSHCLAAEGWQLVFS